MRAGPMPICAAVLNDALCPWLPSPTCVGAHAAARNASFSTSIRHCLTLACQAARLSPCCCCSSARAVGASLLHRRAPADHPGEVSAVDLAEQRPARLQNTLHPSCTAVNHPCSSARLFLRCCSVSVPPSSFSGRQARLLDGSTARARHGRMGMYRIHPTNLEMVAMAAEWMERLSILGRNPGGPSSSCPSLASSLPPPLPPLPLRKADRKIQRGGREGGSCRERPPTASILTRTLCILMPSVQPLCTHSLVPQRCRTRTAIQP